MSQWIHVVGSMSLDYFPAIMGGESVDKLKDIVGSWTNDYVHEDDGNTESSLESVSRYGSGPSMPEGSEGPLMFNVQTIGSPSSMNNGLVTFWGNLRDYGEGEVVSELIPYFENLLVRLKDVGCGVRNMAIQVEVEFGKSRILTQGDDGSLQVIEYIPTAEV